MVLVEVYPQSVVWLLKSPITTCRCCMFVSCVHPMAVVNAAFCMTCSLLMLVEDAISDHTEEAYSRAGLITAL